MIDNKVQGKVYEELREHIRNGSKLSAISAYFTIYAYSSLKKELNKIDEMKLLFTEPTFIDDQKNEVPKEFCIDHQKRIFGNEYEIKLRNEMKQAEIGRASCRERV